MGKSGVFMFVGSIQYNGFGVIFPRESSELSDISEMRLKTVFGADLGQ